MNVYLTLTVANAALFVVALLPSRRPHLAKIQDPTAQVSGKYPYKSLISPVQTVRMYLAFGACRFTKDSTSSGVLPGRAPEPLVLSLG